MRELFRRWCAPAVVMVGLIGCGQTVREDRTIHFAADGGAVSFQHGKEGVYVAGKNGGPPVKVFEPGKGVLATSPPLWAPNDGRLIFATARPAQRAGSPAKQPPEFQEVLVAVSTDRSRDEFWQAILGPFGGIDTNSMTRDTLQIPGRQSLIYEKLAFSAPSPPTSYFFFVHQAQNVLVAVVFSVKHEMASNQEVLTAMEYSLRSLGVGPEAA